MPHSRDFGPSIHHRSVSRSTKGGRVRRRDFAKIAGAAVVAPRIILSDRVASLPATVRHTGAWPSYERAIAIDCLASPGPFNTPDATANPLTARWWQRQVVRHHGGEL
jgi:hypothetical protein